MEKPSLRKKHTYHPRTFVRKLNEWYTMKGRHHLPWRDEKRPYRILVSEMMLQQTQVERVREYYLAWLKRFPTLKSLAEASEEEVLRQWKGLGYYRRARNLKRVAEELHSTRRGRFPESRTELEALPGIGSYTAGAILAFAFDQPAHALDTNIERVLRRIFAPNAPVEELCVEVMRLGSPAQITSALMDFGALVCKARAPDCAFCPFSARCAGKSEVNKSPPPNGGKKRRVEKCEIAIGAIRDQRGLLLPPRGGLLIVKLGTGTARPALQKEALKRWGTEIAVRPACANTKHEGRQASLHRCSLLYGNVEQFSPATSGRIESLTSGEREALRLMKLL